jgi:hypothetical protein
MMLKPSALATAALALLALPAVAQTKFGEHVTLSGFGTIGAVVTDTNDAQYRSSLRQRSGADKDVDMGVDSKLGLQANAKFGDTFSAVGQILVSRAVSNSTSLEWLYGEAQLPAGFSVKLGRMVLPTFMVSDSRAVGYASHWLRAPTEFYAVYPASSFDGGQLVYRSALGPVNLTAQLSAGKSKTTTSVFGGRNVEFNFTGLKSLNVLLESGDWLLRLGQTTTDLEMKGALVPPLTDKFTGVGLQYDNGKAIVMTEYAARRQTSIAGGLFDSEAWYVSAGWRFGTLTPYLTVSRFKPKGQGIPDRTQDSTDALGLRWDSMANVALKAQVQKTKSTSLAFASPTPAFVAAKPSVQVISVAVDFVF